MHLLYEFYLKAFFIECILLIGYYCKQQNHKQIINTKQKVLIVL